MESPGEHGDVWTFTRQDDKWLWIRCDADNNEISRSRGVFDTLEECQADAARHGYPRQK